jgi:hypothetical protein
MIQDPKMNDTGIDSTSRRPPCWSTDNTSQIWNVMKCSDMVFISNSIKVDHLISILLKYATVKWTEVTLLLVTRLIVNSQLA